MLGLFVLLTGAVTASDESNGYWITQLDSDGYPVMIWVYTEDPVIVVDEESGYGQCWMDAEETQPLGFSEERAVYLAGGTPAAQQAQEDSCITPVLFSAFLTAVAIGLVFWGYSLYKSV